METLEKRQIVILDTNPIFIHRDPITIDVLFTEHTHAHVHHWRQHDTRNLTKKLKYLSYSIRLALCFIPHWCYQNQNLTNKFNASIIGLWLSQLWISLWNGLSNKLKTISLDDFTHRYSIGSALSQFWLVTLSPDRGLRHGTAHRKLLLVMHLNYMQFVAAVLAKHNECNQFVPESINKSIILGFDRVLWWMVSYQFYMCI